MKLKVAVTAHDIEHGKRGKAGQCPVARALCRRTGRIAFVRDDCIEFCGEPYFKSQLGGGIQLPIPIEVRIFTRAFDDWKKVEPLEFELEVPADCGKWLVLDDSDSSAW